MKIKSSAALGRTALLIATLLWGSSFVVLKETINEIPVMWILAMRFCGAAFLMFLLSLGVIKQFNKDYIKHGIILGVALFFAYVLQTFGLEHTTPGKNAFLTATYCVIVPFAWWFFSKKRPDKFNIIAALMCLFGIGLVSLDGDLSIALGDSLTLMGSVFFALHIVFTSRAVAGRDVLMMSMTQFATTGILCLVVAPFTAEVPTEISMTSWFAIAYLCIMCTGVCLTLQAFGQKMTSPQSASIILTLESVFGVIISMIFYDEAVSLKVALGFCTIFFAIIVSETKMSFLKPKSSTIDTE